MATQAIGSIGPFERNAGDWQAYTDRFGLYIVANKLTDEKRIVAVFLTTVGSKVYHLLRELLTPSKTSDLKIETVVIVKKRDTSERACKTKLAGSATPNQRAKVKPSPVKFVDISEIHHDAESMFKEGHSSSELSVMVPVTINGKQLNLSRIL